MLRYGRVCLALAVLAGSLVAAESHFPKRGIAGGSPASVYDYPFVVTIFAGATIPRICTGSLVSDVWILTAAHCIDGVPDLEIAVMHGYPSYTESRQAVEVVMHPDFAPLVRPEGWAHDLAMIRLESKFLSRTATTVEMADAINGLFVQPGLMVTALGWGGDGSQESVTAIEKSLTSCAEIPESAVCTESQVAPTIEGGDSGGAPS